ncbi:MAG: DUF6465 family protein [Thomasclavelia spiroformis]
MKAVLEVQYQGQNVNTTDIEKMVKEELKASGVKISTIDTLNIYYTPETSSVYYVATTKDGNTVNNTEPLTL